MGALWVGVVGGGAGGGGGVGGGSQRPCFPPPRARPPNPAHAPAHPPPPSAQGAIDHRLAGGVITASECTALLTAGVVLLSMLGVNVSALLLPAGVAAAIAAKDLSVNFLAGFFLFVAQVGGAGRGGGGGGFMGGGVGWVGGSWEAGRGEEGGWESARVRALLRSTPQPPPPPCPPPPPPPMQPFKLGDRVAVSFSAPGAPGATYGGQWFEGVAEKVDLR